MAARHSALLIERRTATNKLYKRIPYKTKIASGYTTEDDGQEELVYAVMVDYSGLDQLARCAARNKSRESVDGPLCVRLLERKRL